MKTLLLDGIHVEIEQKCIKNLYLRIKQPDGRVVLTAPMSMGDAAIESFARKRLPWIQKHRAAYASKPTANYISGETLFLWGRPYRLQVAEADKRADVFADGERIVLRIPLGSSVAERRHVLDNWYRKQLATLMPALLGTCEQIVGKSASGWRMRDMTSRWGTCNVRTGIITLNLQLVRLDSEFLQYVILHELTHLWEPSHNERFYQLMDGFCPEWKDTRRRLKQT
ncbi:MAG: SprT family zinc-dependent metalloprotease [Clostridia bacterium]